MEYLIAPLNWGLGHAVRCIPLIENLAHQGHTIVLAGDGPSGDFLHNRFPQYEFIHLPHLNIKYSKFNLQVLTLFAQAPKIILSTFRDWLALNKIVKERHFDVIISDNRFGFFTNKYKSIYITHQLNIALPQSIKWLEPLARELHKLTIRKYDQCLVPDFANTPSLGGRLSHIDDYPIQINYIGPQSRFDKKQAMVKAPRFKFLFILSGVEPQRSILESKILAECNNNVNFAMVRGTQDNPTGNSNTNIIDIAQEDELYELINSSEAVVCRSGYTSIMELYSLRKPAILIPTPGQSEQEYLAEHVPLQFNNFKTIKQSEFSLNKLLELHDGLTSL